MEVFILYLFLFYEKSVYQYSFSCNVPLDSSENGQVGTFAVVQVFFDLKRDDDARSDSHDSFKVKKEEENQRIIPQKNGMGI
ncbi:hypothetical protein RE474_00830 [Methanolobus sediminis]|uniref:Uncharacterized protein n=1 Tax=Methanolobus sediminis TaxID=3072978 RepID=A0AA51UNA4_9EURY|nr:hypothetical protein [Methanolobus sediminis]WMW26479.1 hypothetical protein RE474_00830 [Methanolobus sediminis]